MVFFLRSMSSGRRLTLSFVFSKSNTAFGIIALVAASQEE